MKRKLTEEESLIFGAWYQFAYMYGENGEKDWYFHQSLGALEDIYEYLLEKRIIDQDGFFNKEEFEDD